MCKKGVNSISSDPFEEYQRETDQPKSERSYPGIRLIEEKEHEV